MLRVQDAHLDAMEASLTRLGVLSLNIHDEVAAQARDINELHAEVDDAQAQADVMSRRVKQFVEQAGACVCVCGRRARVCRARRRPSQRAHGGPASAPAGGVRWCALIACLSCFAFVLLLLVLFA
jgi:hypothetical protein